MEFFRVVTTIDDKDEFPFTMKFKWVLKADSNIVILSFHCLHGKKITSLN